jgi:filamentous hemagglutinin family protein
MESKMKLISSQLTTVFQHCSILFFSYLSVSSVFANPQGGEVASGSATISQSGNTMTINQGSQQAIINWQSFNIGAAEKTHFQQPANGVVLNRINPTQGASQIYGALTATGKIILINGAGVHFGPNASVNVGSLIASTSDISNANFLKGNYIFDKPSAYAGSIINEGTLQSADYGLVALLGTSVVNKGVISAKLGSIVLGAGNTFTLDFTGDQLINFTVDTAAQTAGVDDKGKTLTSGVDNSGKLLADGGQVLVTARTAAGVLDNAINMDGVAQARSVEQHEGTIILSADNGTVRVTGELNTSGKQKNSKGGKIKVLGNKIYVMPKARLNANGDAGGGEILVGGNERGAGPEQNASQTYVATGAELYANAITNGNGGKVVVYSTNATAFQGKISAMGGALGGDGGEVETSGNFLALSGANVNLTAANGKTGNWLLDPSDITISSGTTTNIDLTSGTWQPTSGSSTSVLNVTDLENSLTNGNVTVDSINVGASGTANGNIDITVDLVLDTANQLIFSVPTGGVINVNASISNTGGGLLEFEGPVQIGVTTASITTTGLLNFSSTIDSVAGNNFGLTLSSGVITTLNNSIGSNTPLSTFTVDGGTMFLFGGGTITTTSDQNYNAAFEIGVPTTFDSTGGAVNFASSFYGEGNPAVSITSATGTTFGGSVSVGADNIGSLVVNGSTTINSTSITTTGTQSYQGSVTLGTGSGTVTFSGTGITLNGSVSDTGSHNIEFSAPVTLDSGSFTIAAAGSLTFDSTITGTTNTLTLSGVNITLSDNVDVESLDLEGGGSDSIGAASITTMDDQTYNDALSLTGATTTFTATDGGVTFQNTLDGASTLVVSTGNGATFNGAVGVGTNLTSIDISSGVTTFGGSDVQTTGDQTYGNVTVNNSLEFTSGGLITIQGTFGTSNSGISVSFNGNTTLNGSGSWGGPSGDNTLNLNSGTIEYNSNAFDGFADFNLGSGANLVLNTNLNFGSENDYDFEGTLTTAASTNIVISSGSQGGSANGFTVNVGAGGTLDLQSSFGSAVPITLTGTGVFESTNSSFFANPSAIVATGAILTLGNGITWSNITINTGATLLLNNDFSGQTIILNGTGVGGVGAIEGSGTSAELDSSTITLASDATLNAPTASDTIIFGSGTTIEGTAGTENLILAGSGSIVLSGNDIGASTALNTITSNVTSLTNTGMNTTTNSNQIYNTQLVLGNSTTLTANADTITLAQGVNDNGGGDTLTLTGGGNNTFNLAGSLAVGSVTVTGSGSGNTLSVKANEALGWVISSSDTGIINGITEMESPPFNFAGIQNLVGSDFGDTFTVSGGTLSGNITGGSGNNFLVGDDGANTWNITGTNTGNVTGVNAFSNIQNLVGGSFTNDFVFADNTSISGSINGTSSSGNTVDYSGYSTPVTVTLTADEQGNTANNSSVNISNFSNIQSLIGTNGSTLNAAGNKVNEITFTGAAQGSISDPTTFINFSIFGNTGPGTTEVIFAPGTTVIFTSPNTATINGTTATFNDISSFSGDFTPYNSGGGGGNNNGGGGTSVTVGSTVIPRVVQSGVDQGQYSTESYLGQSPVSAALQQMLVVVAYIDDNVDDLLTTQGLLDVENLAAHPITTNCYTS